MDEKNQKEPKLRTRTMNWTKIVKRKSGRCASCLLIKKRKDMMEIKDNEELETNEAKEELRKLKEYWDEHE